MNGMASSSSPSQETAARGRLYRMIWRWHFYAGLFCLPFIIILACSGSVYLFRPQIEAWIDRDYLSLQRTGQAASADQLAAAALDAVPGSKLAAIILPEGPDQAARFLVSENGARVRVYVHPDTLEILKTVPEDGRFERLLFRLHGELLMGDGGSILVELAASWAIVMVLSGLYLWWPRGAKGAAGVLYPRLGQGAARFWRDLHAVTGVWISGFALFLLVTGLPWATVWGGAFKQLRVATGTAAVVQDWSTSAADEHAAHRRQEADAKVASAGNASMEDIVLVARSLELAPPVLLSPPMRSDPYWWAKSNAQNRPLRADVALSPDTGQIVSRQDFADRHVIDQIVGFGTAAHEGQLFGPLNQALGVLTALGLCVLCVSAFVMWRRRAPSGVLGAPPPVPDARIGAGLSGLIILCGILLPVLGACLIVIALIERLVLVRLPAVRRWLGLPEAV
jgi:uncharacterized iron-regulated membrane protein